MFVFTYLRKFEIYINIFYTLINLFLINSQTDHASLRDPQRDLRNIRDPRAILHPCEDAKFARVQLGALRSVINIRLLAHIDISKRGFNIMCKFQCCTRDANFRYDDPDLRSI